MGNVNFTLDATVRTDMRKGASRRLRRANQVPGIIYGGHAEPLAITTGHNEFVHKLEHEAFYSHILTVTIDGKAEQAVLKDLQRHPFKPVIMHFDLQRVLANEKIHMHVPLHFINEAISLGVKEGGVVSHTVTSVDVTCLPKDLPEYIEVDLASVKIGGSVHLSDLVLPAGVELVELSHGAEHDLAVAHIFAPRTGGAEEAAAPSAPEGGAVE